MCCDKMNHEILHGRFVKEEDYFIKYQSSDNDEDYGYKVFYHKLKIEYCPFCGNKI